MLILVLDGMWNGLLAETHLYTDHAGADLYVLEPGLGELGIGDLPLTTVDAVRRTPGVAWASPVRERSVMFEVRGATAAADVVGTPPGAHGGAWTIAAGRAVQADDEIVVDSALAGSHGLHLGDTLTVLARPFRIAGLSAGTSGFMAAYVFVTHAAANGLLGTPDATSYVLVGARDAAAVRGRLSAAGFNVLTAAQVAANEERLQSDLFAGPVLLMVAVAFGGGTLVIALTAYTTVVERRREYGIVKALKGDGAVAWSRWPWARRSDWRCWACWQAACSS